LGAREWAVLNDFLARPTRTGNMGWYARLLEAHRRIIETVQLEAVLVTGCLDLGLRQM